MKKLVAFTISTVLLAMLMVIPALAAYPASPNQPAGLAIITGTPIGNEEGWGENPDVGAAAAFDGDEYTFFDPLGPANGYCGIKASEPYVLKEIRIHPRDGFLNRFNGEAIYGMNADVSAEDFDGSQATLIWESSEEAADFEWQIITEDQFLVKDQAFTHFVHFGVFSDHGDVAEVEFWGVTEASLAPEPEPEPVAAVEEVAEAPVVEAAPAPVVAAPVANTAPATGNSSVGIVIALIAFASTAVITTKAIKRQR